MFAAACPLCHGSSIVCQWHLKPAAACCGGISSPCPRCLIDEGVVDVLTMPSVIGYNSSRCRGVALPVGLPSDMTTSAVCPEWATRIAATSAVLI
jgi:hypothetical protein